MNCVGLRRIALDCVGLHWIALDCIGLFCIVFVFDCYGLC